MSGCPEQSEPVTGDAWTHGSRLGREHQSVRAHLAEDHGTDPAWIDAASDGAVHGKHDAAHYTTWAYAYDLPHQGDSPFRRYRDGGLALRRHPPMTTDPLAETAEITGLVTLQFAWGGLIGAEPAESPSLIHLVRSARRGNPGPTLCGIGRFGDDAPGWSLGGGVTGPNIIHKPCPGCAGVARSQFPGLPVRGSVGGREMAEHLGVSHARH